MASRIAASVLAASLVAACGGGAGGDTTSTTTTITDSDTLVPLTTKVLDAASAEALESVSSDGTLRFLTATPLVSGLAPGDVIVAGVTPATPEGLLRTVRTVEIDNDGVTVFTDGALITDAVHRGSVEFTGTLGLDDVAATSVAMPGVEVLASPELNGASLGDAAAAPRQVPGSLTLAPIGYSIDTDLGTGGALRISGSATITPIIETGLSISCDETIDVPLLGEVCAEIPDINFRARLGIIQSADFTVVGTAAAAFGQRFEIVTHRFSPITLVLGVVPVVLTPSITLYIDGSGSLSATMSYGLHERLELAAGFSYNSDTGFSDLSKRESGFTQDSPAFEGQVLAKAVLGAQFDLRIYGVVGPFAALEGGAEFAADLRGLPSAGVLWQAKGCLRLLAGIDSVDVLDLRYESEIYKNCIEFDRGGPNHLPSVDLLSPTPGMLIYPGESVTLRANVIDVDGGALQCHWASSNGGDPFPVSTCDGASVVFSSPGYRTLTLTVTDAAGARAGDAVTIQVSVPPPIAVTILSPLPEAVLYPDVPVDLSGSASEGIGPYTFTWSIYFPTDAGGVGGDVYLIGTGSHLDWLPDDTIEYSACAVSEYALIVLDVTDSLGSPGHQDVLVGFRLGGPC